MPIPMLFLPPQSEKTRDWARQVAEACPELEVLIPETREGAEQAIESHLRLARSMLTDALRWRAEGPSQPLLRGDELSADLNIASGPRLGELLGELAAARYAGEIATREQALAYARTRTRSGRSG